MSKLVGSAITCSCAGRTDAGVHALAQVVNFPGAPDDLDLDRLLPALNGMCGPEIVVTDRRVMPAGWDARFDARSRTYVYAILEGDPPDPFLGRVTWQRPAALDLDAITEAAGHLLGEHDFSSFGRVANEDASPVRTLFELSCRRSGRVVRIKARANAFIRQMVRSLVGTLVQVGEGKLAPGELPAVLAAADRAAAGPVAPPHGLALVAVEYDDGWAVPTRQPFRPLG